MTPTREQYELAARAAGGMLYYDTEGNTAAQKTGAIVRRPT